MSFLFSVGHFINAVTGTNANLILTTFRAVSIPAMALVHGWVSAVGFVLCGILGCLLLLSEKRLLSIE
jgi:hypothetical protein